MIVRLIRTLALAGAVGLAALGGAQADEMSADEKAAIEKIVRDYILENPDIIQEALINLEEKRKKDEVAARSAAVSGMRDLIYDSSRQVVLGNPEASITIVEFFDYNCGYCKRALDDMNAILDRHQDVRVVLKEMPILGPGSVEASRVAIAVHLAAPDRYLEFHRELLGGSGQANELRAMAVVEDIGLDVETIRKAMDDPEVAATIDEVYSIANRLGLSGTPSYVVGDEVVFGAVGVGALEQKIASIRECGSTSC